MLPPPSRSGAGGWQGEAGQLSSILRCVQGQGPPSKPSCPQPDKAGALQRPVLSPLPIPFWAGKESFLACWVGSCWPPLLPGALAFHPAAAAVPWTRSHHPCYSFVPTSNLHRSVKANGMILHMHKIAQMHQFTGPVICCSFKTLCGIANKKKKRPGGGIGSICNTKHFYNNENPSQPQASTTATCSTCCGPGGKRSIIFLTQILNIQINLLLKEI